MNCTRVLHFLNPRPGGSSPIMPVDMAMRICLANSPPLHCFLGNFENYSSSLSHCEPLRPCLSSGRCADKISSHSLAAVSKTTTSAAESSHSWLRRKKKKSVVFADSCGLALTAIHIFSEAEDDLLTELKFHLNKLEGDMGKLHMGEPKDATLCSSQLVLDFTQPAADYLDLRNRLVDQQVCLETCSVQEHLLSGTVQVRNICFEKSVLVRITFDSWNTFQDIPCFYLNNIYGCRDIDTFSFSISMPEVLDPSNSVEFCIQYQTGDQTFWDNNRGDNYCLKVSDPKGKPMLISGGIAGEKKEFDPLGSPRTSAGIFPEWQSWAHVNTSAPYW